MRNQGWSVSRFGVLSALVLFGACTSLNSNPLDGGETGGTGGGASGHPGGGSGDHGGAGGHGGAGNAGATGTGGTGGAGGVTGSGGGTAGTSGQGGTAGHASTGGVSGAGGTAGAGTAGKGGGAGAGATGGMAGTGGKAGAGGNGGPVCGNGVKEGTEQCDLGTAQNTGAYGGCTSTCTLAPYCGDGVVNGSEACDKGTSGNTGAYGGCTATCTLAPHCGDGVVNGSEACDKGTAANTGAYGGCTATCTLAPHCGDGVVNGPEACDKGTSGNTGAYGGCTATCTLAGYCGDGVANGPEACDNGSANGTAVNDCNPACTGLVTVKHIYVYGTRVAPNFGGVAGADALCQASFGAGFKAFLADGSQRIASVSAFKGDGQTGWVLKPYTEYINSGGTVVSVTDSAALLGVTNGSAGTLTNPIAASDDGWGAWTGMTPDYTTGSVCVGWTSTLSTDFGLSVNVTATAVGGSFPNNNGVSNCAQTRHLICVEQ